MVISKDLKKNKVIWALFILLGALIVFTSVILYNVGVARKDTNSSEIINNDKSSKVNIEKQIEVKRIALIKVKNELNNVYSQVETSKEQELISSMSSTLGKMISNPSYNYATDKASIMSIYGALDSTSRDRVKSALFWNIDGESIGQLRQAFGL